MKSRPNLYTNYAKETAIFSNNTQKFWFAILLVLSTSLCFVATDYWILLISRSLAFSIGAWGINIVSGLAGQITLAHGSFIGIGVYTAAVLGGVASNSVWGYELDMLIWLPAAGIVAALFSLILAPIAVRLKGLNLALVTLAFLFICSHIFSNFISVSGGAGIGRKVAKLVLFGVLSLAWCRKRHRQRHQSWLTRLAAWRGEIQSTLCSALPPCRTQSCCRL